MSDVFDDIAEEMLAKFDKLGQAIVSDIQDDLAVPIQFVPGPYGGEVIIRSKPGEYPRRETGALQSGIGLAIAAQGDVITLTISSDRIYAIRLEQQMNRKFLGPAFDRWSEEVIYAAVAAINGV